MNSTDYEGNNVFTISKRIVEKRSHQNIEWWSS